MVWEFERIKTPTSLLIVICVCVSSIEVYVCYLPLYSIYPLYYITPYAFFKTPPTNVVTPRATAGILPSWYKYIQGIPYLIVSPVSLCTNVRYMIPSTCCVFYYVSMRLSSTSINQCVFRIILSELKNEDVSMSM